MALHCQPGRSGSKIMRIGALVMPALLARLGWSN
jgi:hypothetical protein